MKLERLFAFILLMLFLPCCGQGSKEPTVITVMTHDSFSIGENVVAEFEKAKSVKLKFLKSGDAGAALNQAILSKDNPMADVFFGVDNTFLTRALKAGIFLNLTIPRCWPRSIRPWCWTRKNGCCPWTMATSA